MDRLYRGYLKKLIALVTIIRGGLLREFAFLTAATKDPIYRFRRILSIPCLGRTMHICRVTIMLAVLACPSPLIAKSMDELVLECTEYRKLETKRVSIGVDHYLIASCFAYIESFLDQAVTSNGSNGVCFKQDLPLGDLALRVSELTEADRAASSAARDLPALLAEALPCP